MLLTCKYGPTRCAAYYSDLRAYRCGWLLLYGLSSYFMQRILTAANRDFLDDAGKTLLLLGEQ